MSSRPSQASDRPGLLARLAACGPFGFGASSLGNLYEEVDDRTAREAVDAGWALGIRYFDTAPFYGFGLGERRLGDALRGRDRSAYLLSTKAGRLLVPSDAAGERHGFRSPMPFDAAFDYSYDGVMRSFEASLHRLGLSRIDILYLHDLGRAAHGKEHYRWFEQALRGGFRAMRELRDQGAVSAIGLGVNEVGICAESMAQVDFDLFLVAGRFTLLDQSAAPFFEDCRRRGIGIVAAGVFNSGILATGARGPCYYDYALAERGVRERAEAVERVCRRFGVALPAAALQFSASHPAVALTLVGARDAYQLAAALAHGTADIPEALWDALRDEGLVEASDD